jgi:hypothetical protein
VGAVAQDCSDGLSMPVGKTGVVGIVRPNSRAGQDRRHVPDSGRARWVADDDSLDILWAVAVILENGRIEERTIREYQNRGWPEWNDRSIIG